jgi:Protein of unknown function (DUF4038)/Putative collagen-binding domain of a collagenase
MRMRQRVPWRRGCHLLILSALLVLGAWAAVGGLTWFQPAETRPVLRSTGVASSTVAERSGPAEIKEAVAFPLKVDPGRRYLVDSAGKPFLIHGDTAWSLIAELTREEVDLYLTDRRARGFNTILVNLIEHKFATNAPASAYGEPPFLTRGDYSTPNDAYFTHAHWVVCRAAEKGFLVLLTPSYAGSGGSDQGWYGEMVANGPDQLRGYGEYLGRFFRDCPNILWVHGGDYSVPRTELSRAIAEGIRRISPDALHTAHGSRNSAALDHWTDEAWLQVNTIYTARPQSWSDDPVYVAALEQYTRRQTMPFFLIEGVYESEHGADERQLRTQAYQAVLSGASGQVFGNNPIWYLSGPGLYEASMTWQKALGSRGAQSMTHLRNLLMARPWWRLEPDVYSALLTDGLSSNEERAVAARAADGSLALLYLPSAREITIDLGQLAGPSVAADWYDPADGRVSTVSGSPFPAAGSRRFQPSPVENSSGFDDWVLVLESRP